MIIKNIGIFISQVLVLIFGYFVISLISGGVSGSDKIFDLTKEEQIAAGVGLLYVAFFFSTLILYLCKRINLYGVKLFLTIFTLHFGITVFLTQIESFIFLEQFSQIIPKGVLPVLVIDLTITTFLFSLLSVIVSGKWKTRNVLQNRFNIPLLELIIKIAVLSISYYYIYTLFGSYVLIPLAGDAFNSYYGNLHLPTWFSLFQIFRGVIWVLTALPLIINFKGRQHETAIAVGLSFAIFMGINLLIPTPMMPVRIRMAHFVEVMSSNFIFGIIVTYVLCFRLSKKESD